jgi:hypothetical protein
MRNGETHARARSPRLAGSGREWCGVAMGTGARHVCEWSTEIRPKALQVRGFVLPFIFAMSLCLIRFDRDRPSQLRDAVTLNGSSL